MGWGDIIAKSREGVRINSGGIAFLGKIPTRKFVPGEMTTQKICTRKKISWGKKHT